MRQVVVGFLCLLLAAGLGLAQSNTTAGLAGVGAGAALGTALGQGGTTPSSAGGGGAGGNSAPIEIQIMVFKGMQEIASNVADRTVSHLGPCAAQVSAEFNEERERLRADGKDLERDNDRLRKETEPSEQSSGTSAAGLNQTPSNNQNQIQSVTARVQGDRQKLDKDLGALEALEAKLSGKGSARSCAILVEDPTSANQIALYRAVQGYVDHLHKIHDQLQAYFSLQITPPSVSFSATVTTPQALTVTNIGNDPRQIKSIGVAGASPSAFAINSSDCENRAVPPNPPYKLLNGGASCVISVTFPSAGTPQGPQSAILTISTGNPANTDSDTTQTVQLAGTAPPPRPQPPSPPAPPIGQRQPATEQQRFQLEQQQLQQLQQQVQELQIIQLQQSTAATAAASASTGTSSTGTSTPSASASTPLGLTYLSDIGTALAGLKSNITYGSSSFQPTTQQLEVLVEDDLLMRGVFPYTSTSALDVKEASDALTGEFGKMLVWGNDISAWTNQCKPANPSGGQGGTTQPTPASNSVCAQPSNVEDLAVAQQMITGYTALLSTASDGNGSPVIVDVLRGKILSDRMAQGIPSLQVAVAAAGGSTKTNSIFGANLFYTFAPSYNGGIIATFELRDEGNVLLESGARNVLFAYGKWKSKPFHPRDMKRSVSCDSFCSVE